MPELRVYEVTFQIDDDEPPLLAVVQVACGDDVDPIDVARRTEYVPEGSRVLGVRALASDPPPLKLDVIPCENGEEETCA